MHMLIHQHRNILFVSYVHNLRYVVFLKTLFNYPLVRDTKRLLCGRLVVVTTRKEVIDKT